MSGDAPSAISTPVVTSGSICPLNNSDGSAATPNNITKGKMKRKSKVAACHRAASDLMRAPLQTGLHDASAGRKYRHVALHHRVDEQYREEGEADHDDVLVFEDAHCSIPRSKLRKNRDEQ